MRGRLSVVSGASSWWMEMYPMQLLKSCLSDGIANSQLAIELDDDMLSSKSQDGVGVALLRLLFLA
jgi:hypothetical protein